MGKSCQGRPRHGDKREVLRRETAFSKSNRSPTHPRTPQVSIGMGLINFPALTGRHRPPAAGSWSPASFHTHAPEPGRRLAGLARGCRGLALAGPGPPSLKRGRGRAAQQRCCPRQAHLSPLHARSQPLTLHLECPGARAAESKPRTGSVQEGAGGHSP